MGDSAPLWSPSSSDDMPAVRSIVSGSHRETEIESICYEVDEFGLPWRSYGWFEILGRHLACVRNIINEGRVFDLCLVFESEISVELD